MNQKYNRERDQKQETESRFKTEEAVIASEQRLESYQEQSRSKKQQYNRISIGRLLLFCGIIGGVLLGTAGKFWWGWLIAAGMLITFILVMRRHEKLRLEQQYLENRIQVERRQLARLRGNWSTFPDTGAEFLEEKDYVARDLDIFGTASLYQMLCTAHTPWGRQRLAEILKQGEPDLQCLRDRQEAVQELMRNRELMGRYEAFALDIVPEVRKSGAVIRETGGESTDEGAVTAGVTVEEDAVATESIDIRKLGTVLRVIGIAYTGLFILGIVGAALGWWPTGVILILFFVALGTSWLTGGISSRLIGDIFTQEQQLRSYLQMMYTIKSATFESRMLSALVGQIAGEGSAMEGLGKLEHILDAYNIRHNPIVHWVLSGICLYDYHLAARAADWRIRYEQKLQEGIRALGEIEMLNSLAVTGTLRQTSMPEILQQDQAELSLQNVSHPLIPTEQAVPNSIVLKDQTVIITGSNMSGKTTFLRSIGVNLVLACAGAPVCAEAMRTTQMRLFTSMRVADDVSHGISTFYAEILRIKEMVEYGKNNRPMLCLIDEIFKGTNSADRIVGAEAVIRKLTGPGHLTIVSTHDFELCNLAENYHFEEYYEGDEIRFDYRLKRGMCTTTNALHLLKMAGLTENEK